MSIAVLDTNVLFASASERDEYHDLGQEIVRGIDHGNLPDVIVTNYVVAEILNLTREKLGPATATEILDRLIAGAHFEIVHAPKTDFNSGQELFRQHDQLSFVDATIAAYMQREGIEYLYSFDGGFDAVEGTTRLDTAANPFR